MDPIDILKHALERNKRDQEYKITKRVEKQKAIFNLSDELQELKDQEENLRNTIIHLIKRKGDESK